MDMKPLVNVIGLVFSGHTQLNAAIHSIAPHLLSNLLIIIVQEMVYIPTIISH